MSYVWLPMRARASVIYSSFARLATRVAARNLLLKCKNLLLSVCLEALLYLSACLSVCLPAVYEDTRLYYDIISLRAGWADRHSKVNNRYFFVFCFEISNLKFWPSLIDIRSRFTTKKTNLHRLSAVAVQWWHHFVCDVCGVSLSVLSVLSVSVCLCCLCCLSARNLPVISGLP